MPSSPSRRARRRPSRRHRTAERAASSGRELATTPARAAYCGHGAPAAALDSYLGWHVAAKHRVAAAAGMHRARARRLAGVVDVTRLAASLLLAAAYWCVSHFFDNITTFSCWICSRGALTRADVRRALTCRARPQHCRGERCAAPARGHRGKRVFGAARACRRPRALDCGT